VIGSKNLKAPPTRVLRRPFELCILTEVMQDLRSGDLWIRGSDRYSDYRGQLVTEEEYRKHSEAYSLVRRKSGLSCRSSGVRGEAEGSPHEGGGES
jgi:hypothetical protein